jgi:hypothetical protein
MRIAGQQPRRCALSIRSTVASAAKLS